MKILIGLLFILTLGNVALAENGYQPFKSSKEAGEFFSGANSNNSSFTEMLKEIFNSIFETKEDVKISDEKRDVYINEFYVDLLNKGYTPNEALDITDKELKRIGG